VLKLSNSREEERLLEEELTAVSGSSSVPLTIWAGQ
jgi:hypothetical protein